MQLPRFISGKSELYLIGSLSLICACYIVTTWNQFQSLSFFEFICSLPSMKSFSKEKETGIEKETVVVKHYN